MFLFSSRKIRYDQFLKSELVQLLSICDKKSQLAVNHRPAQLAIILNIAWTRSKGQKFRSHCPPDRIINLEITTMLRQQLIVLPPEARKIGTRLKAGFQILPLKIDQKESGTKSIIRWNSISSSHPLNHCVLLDNPKIIERLGLLSQPLFCIT